MTITLEQVEALEAVCTGDDTTTNIPVNVIRDVLGSLAAHIAVANLFPDEKEIALLAADELLLRADREIDYLNTEAEQYFQERFTLQNKVTAYQILNADLEKQAHQLRVRNDNQYASIIDYQRECNELHNANVNFQNTLAAYEQSVADLNDIIGDQERRLQNQKTNIQGYQEIVRQHEMYIEELHKQIQEEYDEGMQDAINADRYTLLKHLLPEMLAAAALMGPEAADVLAQADMSKLDDQMEKTLESLTTEQHNEVFGEEVQIAA